MSKSRLKYLDATHHFDVHEFRKNVDIYINVSSTNPSIFTYAHTYTRLRDLDVRFV
jgi:hypothetical protein